MIDLLDRLSVGAKIAARRTEAETVKRLNRTVRQNTPGRSSPSAGSRSEEALAEASSLQPRALILITTETFCTGCGARYRAPAPIVLAEYSDNCMAQLRSQQDFRRYPEGILREHRTRAVNAPACERCF